MKNLLMIALLVLAGTAAQAETMSCFVGIVKTKNAIADENQNNENSLGLPGAAVVDVPIKDLEGEAEAIINGEKVSMKLWRREYADVYDLTLILTTPEADRYPRTSIVAMVSDFLINNGPAKRHAYAPRVQDGTTLFTALKHPLGSMTLTKKAVDALKAGGLWGQHPFTTSSLAVEYSNDLAKAATELADKGLLKADDVLALYTAFDCSLNK